MKESPFIQIKEVYKRFGGVKALNGVSLDLYPGEVHCLAGENGCGKSTLIKIISGYYRKDSGAVYIKGENVDPITPEIAISMGIQVVYQDLSLYPEMSVFENIVLAEQVQKHTQLVKKKELKVKAQRALDKIGADIEVDAIEGSLPIAKKQLVSISKALYQDAKLVILDEPTTSLTEKEIDVLFRVLRNMANNGIAVLLVSHKLREVLRVSTQLTIMRNGQIIVSGSTKDFTETSIAHHMTGRDIEKKKHKIRADTSAQPLLQVSGLDKEGSFSNISMSFYPGEIVGITGLLGSGRSEVVRAVVGLDKYDRGEVLVHGKSFSPGSIDKAISVGLGYVPEDRISEGLFLDQSVTLNMISSSLSSMANGKFGGMDFQKIRERVDTTAQQFNIVMLNRDMHVRFLSGGNAQKVVLGRWLLAEVELLFLNGPTIGVDIGAKYEIYDKLRILSEQGIAIVIISDDIPELAMNCDRVIILHRGAIVHELMRNEVSEDRISSVLASLV